MGEVCQRRAQKRKPSGPYKPLKPRKPDRVETVSELEALARGSNGRPGQPPPMNCRMFNRRRPLIDQHLHSTLDPDKTRRPTVHAGGSRRPTIA